MKIELEIEVIEQALTTLELGFDKNEFVSDIKIIDTYDEEISSIMS